MKAWVLQELTHMNMCWISRENDLICGALVLGRVFFYLLISEFDVAYASKTREAQYSVSLGFAEKL